MGENEQNLRCMNVGVWHSETTEETDERKGKIRLSDDTTVQTIFTNIIRVQKGKGKDRFEMHHILAPNCPNIALAYYMEISDTGKDVIHYESGDATLHRLIEEEKKGGKLLFYTDDYGLHHLTTVARKILKGILQGVIDLVEQGHTHGNIKNLTNVIIKGKDGYSKLKNISNKNKSKEDVDGLAHIVKSLLKVKDVKLLDQYKIQLENISRNYKDFTLLSKSLKFLKKHHPIFKDGVGKLDFLLRVHRKTKYNRLYSKEINENLNISHPDETLKKAIPDQLFKDTYNDDGKVKWTPDDSSKWVGFKKIDVVTFFRNRVEHINDKVHSSPGGKVVGENALYRKINSFEPALLGELYDLEYRIYVPR